MLELLGFALFGVFLGTISGLVPGLHVNSIAALFLSHKVSIEKDWCHGVRCEVCNQKFPMNIQLFSLVRFWF